MHLNTFSILFMLLYTTHIPTQAIYCCFYRLCPCTQLSENLVTGEDYSIYYGSRQLLAHLDMVKIDQEREHY